MIIWPGAGRRPVELAIALGDAHVVDAGVATAHQARRIELPELVAVRPIPGAGVIVPFVLEAHADAVAREGPELLDQPVVELFLPLALQEGDDRAAAGEELRAVAPAAVVAIGKGDALGVPRVPGVLRHADFSRRRLGAERGNDG